MKYIQFFLASSIVEFEKERIELANYIRSLNDIYIKKDIYFQLNLCEDISNAIAKGRKQEEYNQKIRESDFFYVIFGREVGDYTLEEFDTALDAFRQKGSPYIYTYFQKVPDDAEISGSVRSFMKRLDQQLGHFYTMFTHIDSVKLNILLELSRSPKVNGTVVFEDGTAVLDGEKVMELKQVPVYEKNNNLKKLQAEKAALNEEFAKLRAEFTEKPEDDQLFQKLMEVSARKNEVGDQLRKTEAEVLKLCTALMPGGMDRRYTWREKAAREYLQTGDYEKALVVLKDGERHKELEQAEMLLEQGKRIIEGYIGENRLRIQALKGMEKTEANTEELLMCLEENASLAKEHHMEYRCLYEYAECLYEIHQNATALSEIDQLEKIYQAKEQVDEKKWLELYMLKSSIATDLCNFAMAEKYYGKAAKICDHIQDWETKNTVYNNYAAVCMRRGKYIRAEKYFRLALEYWQQQDEYSHDTALVCGNLAEALTGQYQRGDKASLVEIKSLYLQAMEIERKLNRNPQTKNLPRLSEVCYNAANYFFDYENKDASLQLYEEAVEIARKAALDDPARETVSIAQRLEGLAYCYDIMEAFEKSQPMYLEAIHLVHEIQKKDDQTYRDILAHLYRNYGGMLLLAGKREEGIEYKQKAIKLYEDLIEKEREAFTEELYVSYMELAGLLMGNQPREVQKLIRKARQLKEMS